MKRLFTLAVTVAGVAGSACAQVPEGTYVGTLSGSHYDLNTKKPTKGKQNAVLIVAGGSGAIITEDGPSIGGGGLLGSSHAFFFGDGSAAGSISVHFGKDYKSAKASLVGGYNNGFAIVSIEGKFKGKKVAGSEPGPSEPPILIVP